MEGEVRRLPEHTAGSNVQRNLHLDDDNPLHSHRLALYKVLSQALPHPDHTTPPGRKARQLLLVRISQLREQCRELSVWQRGDWGTTGLHSFHSRSVGPDQGQQDTHQEGRLSGPTRERN